MNNYYGNSSQSWSQPKEQIGSDSFSTDKTLVNSFLQKVFVFMACGLAITGLTAFLASQNIAFMQIIFGTPLKWVVMFAPFVFVLALNFAFNRLSGMGAGLLFGAFAVVMGLSLSTIFLVFSFESIFMTFLVTSGMFGGLALYGITTKTDLTKLGNILFMALIGLIIATFVNMFFASSVLHWIITYAGVLIFSGLTAYDVQKLSKMPYEHGGDTVLKLAVLGALTLYLDFINLFLFLLRLLGSRD